MYYAQIQLIRNNEANKGKAVFDNYVKTYLTKLLFTFRIEIHFL